MRGYRLSFVVQEFTFALAVASGVYTLTASKNLWIAIVATSITLVAQVLSFVIAIRRPSHSFPNEQDPKFSAFFSSWYEKDGDHYIFCNDLDWLDRTEVAQILATLKNRARRVHIILSDSSSTAAAEISAAGGTILLVPAEVVKIRVKMSLRVDNEIKEMIIRQKKPGTTRIQFVESEDSNLIALAETLLVACGLYTAGATLAGSDMAKQIVAREQESPHTASDIQTSSGDQS